MKNVIQRCKTELLKRFRFFPVLFSVPFIPVRWRSLFLNHSECDICLLFLRCRLCSRSLSLPALYSQWKECKEPWCIQKDEFIFRLKYGIKSNQVRYKWNEIKMEMEGKIWFRLREKMYVFFLSVFCWANDTKCKVVK